MITINTQYFREAALFHEKHGRYDDGVVDTYDYHAYWEEERHRCLYGYSVGGMRITGYHYWYLNYWPIIKTIAAEEELYGEVFKDKRKGDRVAGFADFWDVDYSFFNELEQAELHGQHMVWLKPRGVGASFKGSSLLGRNFFLIPDSKGYLFASDKTFLTEDGLFSKWLAGRMHINSNHPDEDRYKTAFGKPSDYKKDNNEMHYRASSSIGGVEQGYMSEVIGITFHDKDYQKHRGKRGKIMLLEEMGAFPGVETVFNVARSSVQQGRTVFGTIIGFGTGGTEASDFGDMEKMFYSPEAYNIRCFDNIWDEGMQGTKCAYFTPAYRNIDFKDENGNSNELEADKFLTEERVAAAKSPDGNAIIQAKAEHPRTPQEAILRNTSTVLPANEAIEWYHKVISGKLHTLGVNGYLTHDGKNVVFKHDPKCKPIDRFPHDIKGDLTGCIVQYWAPLKKNERVPENLYFIALDPYAHDQSTDMGSIGAAYVYMAPNNLPGGGMGDKLVATYFARPSTMDEFNKNLFLLAQYYNAKIGFENDRGNTIDYAKRFKLLDWLADEFELAFDADLPKSKVRRQYGMHIGSGKENIRIHKGNKYLNDWLITDRGKDEDGNSRMNLHTILCPSTLKEISQYRSEGGNFDRVSALRILAYYQKEIVYKELKPADPKDNVDEGFFNRRHFL